MRLEDWKKIRHFSQTENWGDASKMDYEYVIMLDTVRHLCDVPFALTSPAYTKRTGHSKDSYHYYGRAADYRLLDIPIYEAYDLLVATLKSMGIYEKVGFGFYPDWTTPGFHLDDRAMHQGVLYKPGVVWIRIDNPKHGIMPGYYYADKALEYIEMIRWEQKVSATK